MAKRCVVNFATATSWFPDGQKRLLRSLQGRFDGDFLSWVGEGQLGCPPHSKIPYAFKPYGFQKALDAGYETVLWLDCSVTAIKNINPVFEEVEDKGFHFEMCGWSVGEFSTDACLKRLGITRDEGMKMPLYSAGMTALDLRREKSREFLRLWREYADDGVSFPGPWNNAGEGASSDPRCKGHRHDQTVASALAHRLEMYPVPGVFFEYWTPTPKSTTVALLKGP